MEQERATWADFRLMMLLVGPKSWHPDDEKNELPVERAEHWLPLITKLHVPQQALYEHLHGRLFYWKDNDGTGWKNLIGVLLAKRALVLLELMAAINRKEPVRWSNMHVGEEVTETDT